MKKKRFTATATMRDDTHEWDVIIYSSYETMREATDGAERYRKKFDGLRLYDGTVLEVVKIEIK